LVAAIDPHDSVGLLDQYSLDTVSLLKSSALTATSKKCAGDRKKTGFIMYLSAPPTICMMPIAGLPLRGGATQFAKKPLVVNPWNLDPLQEMEAETAADQTSSYNCVSTLK